MFDAVGAVVRAEPRIDYAFVFGSHAKGTQHAHSDLDVAIAVSEPFETRELLDLVSRMEAAVGRDVDLVVIDEAPPALAYRIFRDGVVVFDRNHESFVRQKAKAILDYLDFRPIEEILVRGALAAARNG